MEHQSRMERRSGAKHQSIPFVPLLFAADINVYSVARAFHEEYGIISYCYGKFPSGPCHDSKIIRYTADERVDQQDVFLKTVLDFAAVHSKEKVLLIGCGDSYVQLISENKDRLPENVIAPYIGIDLMNELIHKEKFYELCEQQGVDYPSTFVHRMELENSFQLPFDPPYIVKPSNGIEYWQHSFPTQKKVYKADSMKELCEILGDIYGAGYRDSVIIQDFIPGDDTFMRVLTGYSDHQGQVKLMALGHVLLEEHTPHGLGNHAVILTEENRELSDRFRKLLEALHYVGFSNFDIKYDQRDGKYKVFEINTRQGRSNFYVTGAGANLMKCVVDDWVYHLPLEFHMVTEPSLWMVVPKKVAFAYIKPEKYRREMKELIRRGKLVNPLFYPADRGLMHGVKLWKNQLGHFVKFKKYLGKK